MTVIIDANALILACSSQLRLFDEIERLRGDAAIRIPESVVNELNDLCEDGDVDACTAARLVNSKGLKTISGSGSYADEAIRNLAIKHRATVVTHDADLIQTLTEAGVDVLRPRQTSHLVEAH